ncbi:MAG TPA: acylphosphatase [Methanotrichaceae archaeon]|nr:acylphosphatase [Methanotrichaceae archaeon]
MKKKITIIGPRVHDVGYRYLLMGGAMSLHLPGFDAINLDKGDEQAVEVLVEGKDSQVKAFVDFMKNNRPASAVVSDIAISEYDDDVSKISEYAQVLTAMQMLKAIPTILEVRDNTRSSADGQNALIDGQGDIIEEMHELHEDLMQNVNRRLDGIEKDMRVVKTKLGIR